MKKQLLFKDTVTAHSYLEACLKAYPYDIEEKMVYSLLQDTTYPHPVLLSFISYFQTVEKYHLYTKKILLEEELWKLFEKLSLLSSMNASVLRPHHFAFDATFEVVHHTLAHPYAHLPLERIPVIDRIQLHHVPLLSMPTHKPIEIVRSHTFIFRDISMDASTFLALRIRIADKQGIIFLSKECLSLALCLAQSYTLAPLSVHQDFILIFGLSQAHNVCEYYYDETNELLLGKVAGDASMHHFLYLKEMIQTLYNTICLRKHDLPLHASMLGIQLHQQRYGLVFAGESGTGKSEILMAMVRLCKARGIACTPLYDDHGTWHYLDNEIVSTGGEVSSCMKISYMRKRDVFDSFADSIFLREDDGDVYQITPLLPYAQTIQFHKVTHVFYLDTVSREHGYIRMYDLDECMELFIKGPYRNQLGKISSSFFFNPLGPQQAKEETTELVRDFLTILYVQDIPVYSLYTGGTASRKVHLFEELAMVILAEILG